MDNKVIKYLSKAPEKKDDRVLRFVGSDESIDRDNESIMSDGWKLTNYKKNPVVLLNHMHYELPVAKTKRVWIDKNKKALMFDIQFPEPEISSVGDTLYKLYSEGYMNSTSVGFKPNFDKVIWNDDNKPGKPRITFQEQELLELSLVSVPANPRALLTQKSIQDAIKAEVIDQLELDELSTLFDELFEPETDDDDETKEVETLLLEVEGILKEVDDILDDEDITEQTINEPVYCHECGIKINKDNPDSDYLEQLFDEFCNPSKDNTKNEEISLTDELLNKYFNKE